MNSNEKKFTILNLISIKLSDFKLYSISEIVNDSFNIDFSEKMNIQYTKEVVVKMLEEYSGADYKLFAKKEIIPGIFLYSLETNFQELFYNVYKNEYMTEKSKDEVAIWILNGNQFLFSSNIMNMYQKYHIEKNEVMEVFSSLQKVENIKRLFHDLNSNKIFYINNLQEEHTSFDGKKRLRVRKSEIENIKKFISEKK